MNKDGKLESISFIKTILMLLVILGHSVVFWSGGQWLPVDPVYDSKALSYIAKCVGSFHVYAFTLVSGYLYCYQKYDRGNDAKNSTFLKKKAMRLLIPYVFVSAIWVIPSAIIVFKYGWKDILLKYILGSSPNQLWFLLMLFWVFLFFNLLSDFFYKHEIIGGIIALVLFYAIGIIGQKYIENYYQIWTAFRFLPFFWIGFKLRQHNNSILKRIHPFFYGGVFVAVFVVIQLLPPSSGLMKLISLGLDYILLLSGSLAAFFILEWLYSKMPKLCLSKLNSIQYYSMPMYLFHQQFIYYSILLLNGKLYPYLHATVNLIVALIGSFAISFILMKWKTTRLLVGETKIM